MLTPENILAPENLLISVGSNLIANAIISVFGKDVRQPNDGEITKKYVRRKIEAASYVFEWDDSLRQAEEVSLFLQSPEVQNIVEQVFGIRSVDKADASFENIKNEFGLLYKETYEDVSGEEENKIEELFDFIVEFAIKAFDEIAKSRLHGAEYLLSVYQFNRLNDRVAGIEKNINFLRSKDFPKREVINLFEKTYREQCGKRLGQIRLNNLKDEQIIPIDSVYVAQTFIEKPYVSYHRGNIPINIGDFGANSPKKGTISAIRELADDDSRNIEIFADELPSGLFENLDDHVKSFRELCGGINRTVILGNPGGGKSTLTQKICSDLYRNYDERPVNNQLLTPIHVTVRRYAEMAKKSGCSIVEFIEQKSNSKYQLEAPTNAVEYLLNNSRVLVIFDGLDELLDSASRREIVENIEGFCSRYPSVPVLVTSREVGYEQVPLGNSFEVYKIAEFSETQIQEYAEKYFELDSTLSSKEKEQNVLEFLRDSGLASDIRSNPLMLGLMCSVYKHQHFIPQNRPELYKLCSEMLFDKWDVFRGIGDNLSFRQHLKPGLMHLAHWMFTDEALSNGVDKSRLVEKTAGYLEPFYGNRNEAELIAASFVDFCRGRAWVFTEIGENVYEFTHRTFLEYFTALYLSRNYRSAEAIVDFILPKVEREEWDVVTQLLVQITSESFEGEADEIISRLLNSIRAKEGEELRDHEKNLLSFLSRCLLFLNPTYKTLERFVTICVSFSINEIIGRFGSFSDGDINLLMRPNSVLTPQSIGLIEVSPQNKTRINEIVCKYLVQYIGKLDMDSSAQNDEIGKTLNAIALIETQLIERNQSSKEFYDLYSTAVGELPDEPIQNVYLKYRYGVISLDRYVEILGLNGLFFCHSCLQTSICGLADGIDSWLSLLEILGRRFSREYFSSYTAPGLSKQYSFFTGSKDSTPEIQFEDKHLFGLFIHTALLAETPHYMPHREVAEGFYFPIYQEVINQRVFNRYDESTLEDEIKDYRITENQKNLIRKWVKRDVNFSQDPILWNDPATWNNEN